MNASPAAFAVRRAPPAGANVVAIVLAAASLLLAPAAPAQDRPPEPSPATATGPRELVVSVPIWPNSTCAIMGKPVSTRLFVDIEYGRMYVCCKSCNRKIRRDPHGTYKSAYPTTKVVGNTVCPVSGEPVPAKEPPTVLLQGHEIALARPELAAAARENAQVVLAKVLVPNVVDVNNRACPITGEQVQPNAYCLIGDKLVHLSSPSCVKAVEQDPAKALALALDRTREPLPSKPGVGTASQDEDGDDDTGMESGDEKPAKPSGGARERRGGGKDE